jgi:hypothetical protein
MGDKKQPLPLVCPVCQGEMEIRELECKSCDLQVRGHFGRGSRFDQLNPEQSGFLEIFLRSRGILRDVESALGISYPTVRARLDGLLLALGFSDDAGARGPAKPPAPKAPEGTGDKTAKRKEILAALEAGSIDAQSAMEALQELK